MKSRRTFLILLAASIVLWIVSPLAAQNKNTEHTLTLAEGAQPKATIDQVAWIAGHWRGEGLGGQVEEIWAPPIGDSMAGVFRLVRDGKLGFLEILTIVEEEGTLILRLKHFNGDLKGWEEKDETVDFRFVKADATHAWFEGMTFERVGEDKLNIYVANRRSDGTISELAFHFKEFE